MPGNVAPTPHLRISGSAVTVTGLTIILFATLLPESGASMTSPFCLICGTFGGVDFVLNLLLFVPLGVGLSLSGLSTKRAILAMLALSTSIELAQLLLIVGRDATLGDIVSNALGGASAFVASRYARIWLRPSQSAARFFYIGWCVAWLAIQTISGFAFLLALPDAGYYGQLSPTLGNFAVFRGRVLSAGVDGMAIPNTAFADSRGLRAGLENGRAVTGTVIPDGPTSGIAPILRVVDADHREIVLIAQNGVDLLFAIQSGGTALKLRPPLFALREVFPSAARNAPTPDTMTLSGRNLTREVRMTAGGSGTTRSVLVPITASLGWTLILPWQWQIEGTRAEGAISWIWVACLVLPIGYWAGYSGRPLRAGSNRSLQALVWAIGFLVVYVGIAFVPYMLGLSSPQTGELGAGCVGMILGGWLSTTLHSNRTSELR
jgi:glycopeptide antibiotics resistance protein